MCFSTFSFMKWKFATSTLPICHLCTCLHNNSSFCKISHLQYALNCEKEHNMNIVMMAKQYVLCKCWAYFCKSKEMLASTFNFAKFNGCFISETNFFPWCRHVLPNLHGPMLIMFCLCMCFWSCKCVLTWVDFIGHLCWNGQF